MSAAMLENSTLGVLAPGALGHSTGPMELMIEYLMIFAILVPLTGGAMATVTMFQFRRMYLHANFDTWKLKFNPKYPTVLAVTQEIFALTICTIATLALLAVSVQLGMHGYNSLFDVTKATASQNIINFAIAFWAVDFYSYAYHLLGHKIPEAWAIHRFHHKFSNPTPFGVIADDMVDQVVRAMPLLFLPLLMGTLNWVVLSAVFTCDLYYGVLLHSGHENLTARKVANFFEGITGTDIINTPLNHYLHHAISGGSSPKYCGFYVTLWDKLFGSEDKQNLEKFMKGLETRTKEEYAKVEIPNYEILGSASYWMKAMRLEISGKEADNKSA
jgi:sterol desaturase/sphingolipid hydroxylase (fatty acid hydroxylase superfamily)